MALPDLRRFVSAVKPKREEIERYIQFTENRYARNLVYKNKDFECLVLCCRPGQRSPVRDPGPSICAVYPVEGQLCADNYRKTANGRIPADYYDDFGPRTRLTIQTTDIDQVA